MTASAPYEVRSGWNLLIAARISAKPNIDQFGIGNACRGIVVVSDIYCCMSKFLLDLEQVTSYRCAEASVKLPKLMKRLIFLQALVTDIGNAPLYRRDSICLVALDDVVSPERGVLK